MEDEYLRSCSKGMVESIRAADPEGVWLTQTWVFIDFSLWTKENILLILIIVSINIQRFLLS